ncbi:hypothetical protein T08_10178 [Trichinella sp. T8]|nr:hypothetical protein T08_13799 [Trichinella sp. T8]KRZ93202.1 hypothetical protein T08_10178 [Trichinella sp. T8]
MSSMYAEVPFLTSGSRECAVQHGFHHQRRNIQSESQTGQAVSLAFEDHRLLWPKGFVDADLQIGLFQVDQGHIDALTAPLAQLLAAHVRIGSMALNMGVQLPEVHHGPDLLLVSLDRWFRHQWQQPFGRAVFALVVRHEPPVLDPLPELVFIRYVLRLRATFAGGYSSTVFRRTPGSPASDHFHAAVHERVEGQYVAVKSLSRILIPASAAAQNPGSSSPNRTHRPPVTITPPSAAIPFMPSMIS